MYIVYMDAMVTDPYMYTSTVEPLCCSDRTIPISARDVMVEHYPEYDYLPK